MADPIPFLFPGDPLRPRRVDGFFADEHAAALKAGAEAFLVDHDALVRGDLREAVRGLPRGLGPVRYRGWMVPAARYAEFARVLAERGCRPAVSAEDYRRAHELPGWYALFEAVTPRSVWCEADPGCAPDPGELAELVRPLRPGPGIVKDYVKSRKHEWAQACFVPDLADTGALHRTVVELVRLQQEDLAGGWWSASSRSSTAPARPGCGGSTGSRRWSGRTRTPRARPPTRTWTRSAPPSPPWGTPSSPPTWPAAPTAPGGWWRSATARSAAAPMGSPRSG